MSARTIPIAWTEAPAFEPNRLHLIRHHSVGELTLWERKRGKESWILKWMVYRGTDLRGNFRRLPAALRYLRGDVVK